MTSWLKNLILGILKILKDTRTLRKGSLILFWIRIKLKSLGKENNEIKEIRFLGFDIRYFSAQGLAYLVEEIFINHLYRFKSLHSEPFIIDAGSNIGMSILYFKLYYPKCKIMGFEADRATFELCQANIAQNNLVGVELKNVALWHEKTFVKFYTQKKSTASLNQGFFAQTDYFTEVPTELLSSYIQQTVDFLKMDIEGAEKNVFADLEKQKSLRFIQQMCIESHLLKGETENLKYLLSVLEAALFSVKLGTHTLVNYEFDSPQDCMIYAKNNT